MGVAPRRTITSAVEIKVKGVVITSSPGFTPMAIRLISNASVPLDTVMQCLLSVKIVRAFLAP